MPTTPSPFFKATPAEYGVGLSECWWDNAQWPDVKVMCTNILLAAHYIAGDW